jgi:energy-coupling factor transport system ATP-binding protein
MMMEVSGLSFGYDQGAPVLRDVHLDFDRRSTAIIGQNGAGKTTFVKLVKGLLKPFVGEVIVCGQDVSKTSAAVLAKTMGLVFQNPNDQIFRRTVLDEAMFGPLMIKMDKDTARNHAIEALKMVEFDQQLEINPHDLSLSEKKLLCIASVVAMDTDIIILDEPTIAQDVEGKKKISGIIQALKAKGKLVMTIIHDMEFVADNFERTIVFNEGRVLLDGDTRWVFGQREILQKAFVEPPGITQLANRLGIEETILTADEFINKFKVPGSF